jgi:8-oxo-dGTP diphosphatase
MTMRDGKAFEDYPRPSLAVDPAVLTVERGRLVTLLWRRANEPSQGAWALPGVFVNEQESLEAAVARALREKVGIAAPQNVHQLLAWNKPDRDPRGWVVTIAYSVLLPESRFGSAALLGTEVDRFVIEVPAAAPRGTPRAVIHAQSGEAVEPAFDHDEILGLMVTKLRDEIWRSDVALEMLPPRFTLRALQEVFEAVLGRRLNKDSFRRRVTQSMDLVVPTGTLEEGVGHRPAELYRAKRSRRSRY